MGALEDHLDEGAKVENNKVQFFKDFCEELERARSKFPDQNLDITAIALAEECGEACRAYLHAFHEKPIHPMALTEMQKECVQTAVMAFRLYARL
jgi:hypothetical protein